MPSQRGEYSPFFDGIPFRFDRPKRDEDDDDDDQIEAEEEEEVA